jgi:hypothetical protein
VLGAIVLTLLSIPAARRIVTHVEERASQPVLAPTSA